jgi:hypothetical protein
MILEPIRDPHLMEVVGVHILDTEFGGLQSDQRSDVLESNRSWASGETPIEVLLHEEAMKQLNSIDMGVLCRIATRAHGRGSCTILPSMTCIGASNIVVFIAFDDDDEKDGTRWVARFPLLGLRGLTDDPGLLAEVIDSMVTTMQYVSKHTSIPVPNVHHWNSTSSNELGRPYVLMDAARGNSLYELDRVGMDMEEVVKKLSSFVDQWAMYNAELASLQFERIGALKQEADGLIGVGRLCTQENLHFTPLVEADNYRGPFTSVADFLFAMSELTTQGRYSTRNPTNKYSYQDFLHSKLIISMLPYYVNPNFLNGPFVLSHVDLDIQNILVDENNGFKITGIVDWDLAAVLPLQSHIRLPDMLLCDKWTMSRQQGKSISPWQLEFAQQYRSHYKLCLEKHLRDRQLDYPVDTLVNSGYLFSRFQHAISEKPDDEGFDELWKHVYGSRLNWKDVIKGMETADWGTVMEERLSLPVPAETDNETSESDKDVQSRPETNDTFIKFGTQDPKWTKRISNKLRWGWWHVEQCLLCRMSSKRVPVLMQDGRGLSAPPSSVAVMLTDYRKTGEENEVEQTKEV